MFAAMTDPAAFTQAILREPAADFAAGLTTVTWSSPPDFDGLQTQHRAYARVLESVGLRTTILPALPGHPDAYFVEDAALILPELVVITRPGAEARRGETAAIVAPLRDVLDRELATITAPATLDGGDVMVCGREVFVGLSSRSNAAGVEALSELLTPRGYRVRAVAVGAGLHLKSGVNLIAPGLLLATAAFAARPEFAGYERIVTAADEDYAANALWVREHLLIAAGFPALAERLAGPVQAHGLRLVELDMSEVAKMDGGLSCLSLRA